VNFTMPQDVAANFTLENNGIAITQANGEAHVTLKGKKAGTHTVTATLSNNNTSDSQPVTFVADKTSALVVLQISKNEITGNGCLQGYAVQRLHSGQAVSALRCQVAR
jgi:adhesin/invasin